MLPVVGSMRPSDSGALRCAHLSAKHRQSPPPSRHSTRSLPAGRQLKCEVLLCKGEPCMILIIGISESCGCCNFDDVVKQCLLALDHKMHAAHHGRRLWSASGHLEACQRQLRAPVRL